ncbi:hypothetical protein DFJ63DRAFT_289089 [Scheffersomyces coipomensis]|uniref:uncharacterized protein n=1 Tax=Scheffersomyces coipomensis TaxID=1788519 RepID=UPI00315DF894
MANVFRRLAETDRNARASLYFGNLDPQITELVMFELFIQFAPVRSLNMPKDRILKTHQGFGFVEFNSIEEADYVLNILRGIRLYGKALKLKKTEAPKANFTGKDQQIGVTTQELINNNYIDVGAQLFINNLNPLIDEQYLKETFAKFGTLIRNPLLMRDVDTGESKGYAFITFDDFKVSDYVIEKMNGAILMNSKIHVSYAFKQDPITGQHSKVRHGDKVERLLAESAKTNKVTGSKPKKKINKVHKPKTGSNR